MKIRKICDIVILIAGILAVLSLGVVYTNNRTLGDMAENFVSDMLEDSVQITEQDGEWSNLFSHILRGDAGEVTKAFGDKIQDSFSEILTIYKIGLFLPSLLAVIAMVLVWVLQKRWRYLAAFGTGLAGILILSGSELLIIPICIYRYIEASGILKWIGDVVKVTDLSKMVVNTAGVYYWIGLSWLLLLTFLSLVGFFVKEKSKAVSENGNEEIREIQEIKAIEDTVCTPPDTQPEIRGIAGAYAGGIIPVHRGEMLLLGSDLKNCNLILEGEGISECHCSVEFDRESNRYMVMDFSEKGTYTDGNVRLRKGEYEALKRKSILILGSEENIFMLE